MPRKPSCFDCQNADIDPSSPGSRMEPPTPATPICILNDEAIDEIHERLDRLGVDNLYEALAEQCGHFTPVLFETCPVCDTKVSSPLWSWDIWAQGWDAFAVCSEECRNQAEEKFRQSLGLSE